MTWHDAGGEAYTVSAGIAGATLGDVLVTLLDYIHHITGGAFAHLHMQEIQAS